MKMGWGEGGRCLDHPQMEVALSELARCWVKRPFPSMGASVSPPSPKLRPIPAEPLMPDVGSGVTEPEPESQPQ